MNKEDEDNLLKWLKDKDVSEVMDLLMRHGNRYSRRILKFSDGFVSTFLLHLCAFTHTAFMNSLSILVKCSSLMRRMQLAISTYILWCTSCQWF